jgi:hypothetical protein
MSSIKSKNNFIIASDESLWNKKIVQIGIVILCLSKPSYFMLYQTISYTSFKQPLGVLIKPLYFIETR